MQQLVPMYEQNPTPGSWDPRVIIGGFGSIARGNGPVFLGAPVVIMMLGDKRAIGGPQLDIGICGENMNLLAKSLKIGFCWIGFSQVINIMEKQGIQEPWAVTNACVLGYSKVKEEGIVPCEFRPVTWFRDGSEIPKLRSERHNPSRGHGSGGNRAEQQDLPLHREGWRKHNGLAIL